MSSNKCILQLAKTGRNYPVGAKATCGKPVIPGKLTCKDCEPDDMRFYRSALEKLDHSVRYSLDNFPWNTCGTPVEDAISLEKLEYELIRTVEEVESAHTRWFRFAEGVKAKMRYSSGTYIHELTEAQLLSLRELRAVEMPLCVDNPRCVKDCVTECKCHPWYGIVLNDYGTKIDTVLNPVPAEPYTFCIDCWEQCCSTRRTYGPSWAGGDKTKGYIPIWPLPKSMCSKCLDKPLRRRVYCWFDGYYIC